MLRKIKEYIHNHRDFAAYLLIGVLTTLVDFSVYLPLLWWAKLPASASNAIAWLAAMLFAYVANKGFVFRSKSWSVKVAGPELLKFAACRVVSGVLETVFLGLTVDLPDMGAVKWYSFLMKFLAGVGVVVLNYFCSKFVVFRKK